MSSVRYSTLVVRRAIELDKAGWTRNQIPAVLERELGVRPGRDTVQRWIDPAYAEKVRRRMYGVNARRWAGRWRFNFLARATPACREEFVRRLHAEGVPKQSIAKCCTVVFGEPVSRDQVRTVLGRAA